MESTRINGKVIFSPERLNVSAFTRLNIMWNQFIEIGSLWYKNKSIRIG